MKAKLYPQPILQLRQQADDDESMRKDMLTGHSPPIEAYLSRCVIAFRRGLLPLLRCLRRWLVASEGPDTQYRILRSTTVSTSVETISHATHCTSHTTRDTSPTGEKAACRTCFLQVARVLDLEEEDAHRVCTRCNGRHIQE